MQKRLGLFLIMASIFFGSGHMVYPLSRTPHDLIIKTRTAISVPESFAATSLKTSGTNFHPLFTAFQVEEINPFGQESQTGKLNTKIQASAFKTAAFSNIYKVTFANTVNVQAAMQTIKTMSDIEWVQPNYIYHTCATAPNDPYYSKQWGIASIKADKAWDVTQGSPDVIIAIVDTGVDWQHEDLKANIWKNPGEIPDDGIDNDQNGFIDDVRGWSFVNVTPQVDSNGNPIQEVYRPRNNNPMDYQGHGTFLSGIIAAETNNSIGIAGLAPKCKIMPVKAGYQTADGGGSFEIVDAAAAIIYAADNGAKVINLSWGGPSSQDDPDDILLRQTIKYALSKNCVIVAASGNDSANIDTTPFTPAGIPGVIADSAIKSTGKFDSSYSNYGSRIDLAAPGSAILSSAVDTSSPSSLHHQYKIGSGTSYSTPHISAVAGLLLSYNATLTSADVYQALTATAANPNGAGTKDIYYGYGVVDAFKALGYCTPTPPIAVHTPLTTYNVGIPIVITANCSDSFPDTQLPFVSVFYGAGGPYTLPTTWSSISMEKQQGTLYQTIIPSPNLQISDLYYYFKVTDYNPRNIVTLPNDITQPYHIVFKDITGPQIQTTMQNGDFVPQSQLISFRIRDNVGVSTASITMGIYPATGSTVTANLQSSSALQFAKSTFSVDLDKLQLPPGSTRLKILADDINTNHSEFELTITLTNQSSELTLTGPYASSPILNYPNPFNPLNQSTAICYMISKPARITIDIYSLYLKRIKHIQRDDSTGYYEVPWDGKDEDGDYVPPGVYIYTIKAEADGKNVVKKSKIAVIR